MITEKFLDTLKPLINRRVTVTMKSGAIYMGILDHVYRKKQSIQLRNIGIFYNEVGWIFPKSNNFRQFNLNKLRKIEEGWIENGSESLR